MRTVLLMLLVVAICSCTTSEVYVKADKMTYDAIAPEYVKYVEADKKLDKDAKARRVRLVETWKKRIDGALEQKKE